MKILNRKLIIVSLLMTLLVPALLSSNKVEAQERFDSYIDEQQEKIIISENGNYVILNPLTRWMFENDIGVISEENLNQVPAELHQYVFGVQSSTTASANGAWSVSTNRNWIGVSVIYDSNGYTLWCLDASKSFPNGNGYTPEETTANQGLWNLMGAGVAAGVGYADIQVAIYSYLAEQAGSNSFLFVAGPITITTDDVRYNSLGGWLIDYGHNNNHKFQVNAYVRTVQEGGKPGGFDKIRNAVLSPEYWVNGFTGNYSVTGIPNGMYLIDAGTGNKIADTNNITEGWTFQLVNPNPAISVENIKLTITARNAHNAVGVYYTSHDPAKQNLGRFAFNDPLSPANITLNFEPAIGDIEIDKTNENGAPLAGAEITLLDENMNKIEAKITGADGKVTFTGKVLGNYFYQETNAPKGYILDSTIRPITLNSSKANANLKNQKQFGRLEIYKSDIATGFMLANAEYTLSNEDGSWTETKITDEQGFVEFTKLDVDKKYFLQETKAPSGFEIDNTVHEILLISDQKLEEIVLRKDFTNTAVVIPELPNTGQQMDFIVTGASLTVIGLFLLGARKRFNA